MNVVADTHAVIWLLSERHKLSRAAATVLDQAIATGGTVFVSAITLVEMTYLVEKRKIPAFVLSDLERAIETASLAMGLHPVELQIARALARVPRDAVPDMPDRIIAATALHLGLPLVTRDGKIRASGVDSIW
ncbi:MAG: type II toxin-antitoxin system VapC family toxin [Chloroflexi bacterium]|nr:type II toxin-antitoxin system VapC family toxin [Chloroflexota bacterium]